MFHNGAVLKKAILAFTCSRLLNSAGYVFESSTHPRLMMGSILSQYFWQFHTDV